MPTGIIDTPLSTNQVEFHPLLNQDALHACGNRNRYPAVVLLFCRPRRSVQISRNLPRRSPSVTARRPARSCLRWILQKGVSINTMSTKPENIRSNFDVMDFTLSSIDMARIDALTNTGYRIVDESLVPWAPKWD